MERTGNVSSGTLVCGKTRYAGRVNDLYWKYLYWTAGVGNGVGEAV